MHLPSPRPVDTMVSFVFFAFPKDFPNVLMDPGVPPRKSLRATLESMDVELQRMMAEGQDGHVNTQDFAPSTVRTGTGWGGDHHFFQALKTHDLIELSIETIWVGNR